MRTEVSTVNASAGSGALSRASLLTNSAAECCASAAEPPLPGIYSRPPFLYRLTTVLTASENIARILASSSNIFLLV